MDDVTTLVQSKVGTQELLHRFHDLFTWVRMKAKSKKSQSSVVDLGQVRRWERGTHQPRSGGESRRAVT